MSFAINDIINIKLVIMQQFYWIILRTTIHFERALRENLWRTIAILDAPVGLCYLVEQVNDKRLLVFVKKLNKNASLVADRSLIQRYT